MQRTLTGLAEQTEAEFLFHLETGAPDATRSALGIHGERVGGGVVLSVRGDTTNYWSKALGFGFAEPVTKDLVTRVCDVYREQRPAVAVLQFAPTVLPPDWGAIADSSGLVGSSDWYKLGHDLTTVPARRTDLRVGVVEPHDADRWAALLLGEFGMPTDGLGEMMAATVGAQGFHAYAAWDGATMVAAATMFVHGDAVTMGGAATVPSHRRRGAQSALLVRRLADARHAGCRIAFAETGTEQPGERNDQFRNMLQLGFTVLYERRNWIWRP